MFLLTLAAIGADALMAVAIHGWRAESEDLRAEAESLGAEIASIQATIEGAERKIAVLEEQREAAAARESELAQEASAELQLMNDVRDVVVDLGQCVTDRLGVVRGLWEHGSVYVASLDAKADQECAEAQATLDNLSTKVTTA